MSVQIINGDCLEVLPTLEANSFHAVVTDPPYELGFMGKKWDSTGVAFRPETWAAVLRVLKPGGFMVAFASTRGYHRMVCAIEDAGFVVHPMLGWLFASGFPKATRFQQPELDGWRYGLQALKPALEPICLAQKPLEGTGSANWDAHGCGGLNIEGCKIGNESTRRNSNAGTNGEGWGMGTSAHVNGSDAGRWPANVMHDGSPEVEEAFAAFGKGRARGNIAPTKRRRSEGVLAANGTRCGVGKVDGPTDPGDTGSASRFFFSAKADAADRANSTHPTVKPTNLMRWLVTLVTPPGGIVLDPFCGTGSTGLAADQLGFDTVLIEKDPTYAQDARRKIERDGGLFSAVQATEPTLKATPKNDLFA